MINYPKTIDFSKFKEEHFNKNDCKYGLPHEVKFCKKCVESNQRPSTTTEYSHTIKSNKDPIVFDLDGICAACNYTEKKSKTDWKERDKMLRELCDKFRRTDGHYDCVVPGSGGKDSVYVSHLLKNEYNMHPITITWAPTIYTDWGRRNFDSWIHGGQDNILITPNGKTHRLLTRLALDNIFHPFQPFIFGQKSTAPKIAAAMNIPLIFYGEDEAEYGSPSNEKSSAIVNKIFFCIDDTSKMTLSGVKIKSLIKDFNIDMSELQPYMPLNSEILEKKKIEVHYFGYYKKWHPQGVYYYAVENSNFKAAPERSAGTYSKYSSLDDKIDDFHYHTTGIKFGRARATEDAAHEIRSGEITREEAIGLVKRYDLEWPKRFEEEIFKYLSINSDEFPEASKMFEKENLDKDYYDLLANTFRSPHLWKYVNNNWKLRKTVWTND